MSSDKVGLGEGVWGVAGEGVGPLKADRASLERDVCNVVRARYGWSPELEDLLAVAIEAVDAVVASGDAKTAEQLRRYCLRRARCRVVDYLRRQRRIDPARMVRQGITPRTPREPTMPINARLPVTLRAQLHVVAARQGWTLSRTLRETLKLGIEAIERHTL